MYKSPLNPHFLILRDFFLQLRPPEDKHVLNCTGLSGQETSGQNYILDACFQLACRNKEYGLHNQQFYRFSAST